MRKGCRADAVITVFFTLVSVLYLGVIFMLIESARIQGARAQTANVTDMGNMSVFGEYEKKLLEDYELFALDGAYGTDDFHIDRVNGKLWTYMRRNTDVSGTSTALGLCFDPWQISVTDSDITGYALLTDNSGEAFYQEAVAYMRDTALLQVSGDLITYYRDAQEADQKSQVYEKAQAGSEQAMESLEAQEKKRKEELEQARQAAAGSVEQGSVSLIEDTDLGVTEGPKMKNPLPALRQLSHKDLLSIVCGSDTISSGSVGWFALASTRLGKQKGNLKVTRTYSGLLNDLLFREYLLDRFPSWQEPSQTGDLKYGLEYVICGKKNDRDNLKGVVKRLLLIREGSNYAYAVSDQTMNAAAGSAAELIIGWLGLPALTAALKHGLLLGWSYGESLLDVRTLMSGGRVPLKKKTGEWELGLNDLANINTLLQNGRKNRERGMNYSGYLRILLNLERTSLQKKRGLDLIEMYIRTAPGLSNFQVDHCVVEIQDEADFSISDVFGRGAALWLGSGDTSTQVTVRGGYSYLPRKGS